MGRKRNGKLKGKGQLDDLGVGGRVMLLKWIFKR
jgi:hypothetical protein